MSGIGIGISPIFGGFVPQRYIEKILELSPLAYWPLGETSGTNADNAEETAAYDGTYSGVTLANATGPDGVNAAPLFDGANDKVALPAALLSAVDLDTGTMAVWLKVSGAGVWTDSAARIGLNVRNNTGTLFFFVGRNANDNTLQWYWRDDPGSAQTSFTTGGHSDTGWFHLAMTWDTGTGELKGFKNGSQEGTTKTISAGAQAIQQGQIGAGKSDPLFVWDGWVAHAAIWTSVLTPAQILELATV